MFQKILLAAFLGFCGLGAHVSVAASAINHNSMILAAQKFLEHAYVNPDKAKMGALLSEDAQIRLRVNHQPEVQRTKAEFIKNLESRHFNNTKNVKLLDVNIKVTGPNTLKIKERSLQKRQGAGLQENGEGTYYVDDTGYWTFSEEAGKIKIARMHHIYTKTKVD